MSNIQAPKKSSFRLLQSAFSETLKEEKSLNNRLNWINRNFEKIVSKTNEFREVTEDKNKRLNAFAQLKVLDFMFKTTVRVRFFDKLINEYYHDKKWFYSLSESQKENGFKVNGFISVNTLYQIGYNLAKKAVLNKGNGLSIADLNEEYLYSLIVKPKTEKSKTVLETEIIESIEVVKELPKKSRKKNAVSIPA